MNKYEQLIEYIINEQEDKARELFHKIVVEKSRDIYESLIDDEDFNEDIGGNQVDDLVDDIEADEQGMQEAEMDMDDEGMDMDDEGMDMDDEGMDMDDDAEMDMGDDAEMDMDDEGMDMDDDVESRVQDLESALEDLKAEFDALMADEESEEENEPGIHDDESNAEFDMEEPKEGMVREYVEKVAAPSNKTEGGAVGARGDHTNVNKTSIVAKKNNMGGTAANIAKGGTEQSPDGKSVPQPSNRYSKGKGNLPGAGSFENVPGAKAKGYAKKATSYEKQHGKEGQTTNGKMPVSGKAVIGSKVR
jgi:hypothetical protein